METKNYQEQLFSQIGFLDLAKSIRDYEQDKNKVLFKNSYFLSSDSLKNADQGYGKELVSKLLMGASIPEGLLQIVKDLVFPAGQISDSTWKYFQDYRFDGKILLSPGPLLPSGLKGNFLYEIVAEDFFLDLISKPVNSLIGLLEGYCRHWEEILKLGVKAYYLPKHHYELFIYLESEVARYYGVDNSTDVSVKTGKNVFNGYRFTGLIDEVPFNDTFIEKVKDIANNIAKSTHE